MAEDEIVTKCYTLSEVEDMIESGRLENCPERVLITVECNGVDFLTLVDENERLFERRHIRTGYNTVTGKGSIITAPHGIHEAVPAILNRDMVMLEMSLRQKGVSEATLLKVGLALSTRYIQLENGYSGSDREANFSLRYGFRPRVVGEVAFSEARDELLSAVDQWLLGTATVKAVIAVNVDESKLPRYKDRPAPDLSKKDELRKEAEKSFDAWSDASQSALLGESHEEWHPENMEFGLVTFDGQAWVGKLDVFVEVFRLVDGKRDSGERVNLIQDGRAVARREDFPQSLGLKNGDIFEQEDLDEIGLAADEAVHSDYREFVRQMIGGMYATAMARCAYWQYMKANCDAGA